MSWRVVVIASNAKVDYKMDYLVIRTLEDTRRVHISEIAVLMLESTAISVTAYALCELLARKVKVIFCDRQRNPYGELIPYSGSYDSTAKIRQQIGWKQETREAVWTEIIRAKIDRQRAVLIHHEKPQAERLTRYLQEIQLGDTTNREGHAAKVYFNALFGMEFSRALPNPINAALNYGYGLILSAINREISVAGYLTQLGIFHDNTFNAYNLGCDLMEPLRPLIDHAVAAMNPTIFEKEEKYALVRLLNTEVKLDGKKQMLLYALRLYCNSVFRALENSDVGEIRLIEYELQVYESDRVL